MRLFHFKRWLLPIFFTVVIIPGVIRASDSCTNVLVRSSEKSTAIDKLRDYLAQQVKNYHSSAYRNSADKESHLLSTHRLVTENGITTLKIGFLKREHSQFMRLVALAIKEGQIHEIDAGGIIGPKVLMMMTGLIQRSIEKGYALTFRGHLEVANIEGAFGWQMEFSKLKELRPSHLKEVDEYYWSEKEINDFKQAIEQLDLEKICLQKYNVGFGPGCGTLYFRLSTKNPDDIQWSTSNDFRSSKNPSKSWFKL